MSLETRVGRLERDARLGTGPCALCEARARRASERARDFGPEWTEEETTRTTFECRDCGSPFTVVLVSVLRREEAAL